MKDIINVKLKTQTVDFVSYKTDVLAVGLFSDAKELDKLNKELNKKLDGAFKRLMGLGDFKGKEGTNAVVYGNNKTGAADRRRSWAARSAARPRREAAG